jgi:hypothetical protein
VYLGIIFWTNYPISVVTFVLAPGISGRIRRLSQESFSAACWGHRLWLLLP